MNHVECIKRLLEKTKMFVVTGQLGCGKLHITVEAAKQFNSHKVISYDRYQSVIDLLKDETKYDVVIFDLVNVTDLHEIIELYNRPEHCAIVMHDDLLNRVDSALRNKLIVCEVK
jgi:hypothetical protein